MSGTQRSEACNTPNVDKHGSCSGRNASSGPCECVCHDGNSSGFISEFCNRVSPFSL